MAAAEAGGVCSHGRVVQRLHAAPMLLRLSGFDRCAKLSPRQKLVGLDTQRGAVAVAAAAAVQLRSWPHGQ
eukprot:9722-Chlamydomonas_euryale.AAC.1